MLLKILILIIIIYIINYFLEKKKEITNIKKQKLIKINGGKRVIQNDDFFDILFKIEGYYDFNQQAYLDLLKYTELFLEIVDIIRIDPHYSTNLYSNLRDIKLEILNTLISFQIELPNEFNINDVINDYCKVLDKYLNEVYEIHEDFIKQNGFDYTMKLIHLNSPQGYNQDKNVVDPDRNTYFNRF